MVACRDCVPSAGPRVVAGVVGRAGAGRARYYAAPAVRDADRIRRTDVGAIVFYPGPDLAGGEPADLASARHPRWPVS